MAAPPIIGYWSAGSLPLYRTGLTERQKEAVTEWREQVSVWPDPRSFVDPDWAWEERESVALFLELGTLVNQYRGISSCRFCDRHNGTAELSDGAYCWPEGLAHYVWEHDVRLPQLFESHVRSSPQRLRDAPRPSFGDLGQRDRSWPGAQFAHLLWTPAPGTSEESDGLPWIDIDTSWWLQQKADPADF